MKDSIGSLVKALRHIGLGLVPALLVAQPAPPAPPVPPVPPSPEKMAVMLAAGRSFLGVGVKEIDAERSKALRLKEEYGVEVTRVEDDSPAAKAGLKVEDVVLEYNGQRVEGTEQFVRLVRETPAWRTVKLLVSRGGSVMTLSPAIAARKGPQVFAVGPDKSFKVDIPPIDVMIPDIPKAMMSWRSSMLGVEAESLGDSQLAAYFGVKEGVLVRSVMKGTAAEKAGIIAGDVLLKADGSAVTAPRDVTSAIRSARSSSRKSLPILLMREKKEVTVTVMLEDEPAAPRAVPRTQRITVREMRL